MKRSSFLDLNLMRKHTRTFVLAPISLAVLTACSAPRAEQVIFVSYIDDCAEKTSLSEADCEAAYQQAVADAETTAPRYRNLRDCESEFGSCEQRSGFFMPFMAGYIVSGIVGGLGDSLDRNRRYTNSFPAYIYRGRGSLRNRLMTADGFIIGAPGRSSYRVSREALKPKPAVTRTISRGGFGATASARSNWGSARFGSFSSSWGG